LVVGDELSYPYRQITLNNTSTLARIFRYLDRLIREAVVIAAPQQHEPGGWMLPKQIVEASEPFPEIERVAGNFQE
jgi:hypothetical protein